MKNLFQINILCLFALAIYSCKGQKVVDQPKEGTIENLLEVVNKSPAVDSYFRGNVSNTSPYGPENITRSVIQDKNGNFWFATWAGIIGYDGKTFTNYTNKEGLNRFRAFSIFEDSKGIIWFGTVGAGVYRYDPNAQKAAQKAFTHISTADGLIHNSIGCITEDKAGKIWFGTMDGLSIYDPMAEKGNAFTNYTTEDGLTDMDINAIVEDKNGIFWIATRGDACFYDGKTFTNFKSPDGKSFVNTRSMIEDSKGNLWLGGQDGLWHYDGTTFTNLVTNFIGYIFEDKKGNIWVSKSAPNDTYSMSLCRYDNGFIPSKQDNSTLIRTEDGQIFGITEDTDGNIWFGNERGICRYNPDMGTAEEAFHFFKEDKK